MYEPKLLLVTKYTKQKLTNLNEKETNIQLELRNFNIYLYIMGKTSIQGISKNTGET